MTALKYLQIADEVRYEELCKYWDDYPFDGFEVYKIALNELGMIAFHNEDYIVGIPNIMQREFIRIYREKPWEE